MSYELVCTDCGGIVTIWCSPVAINWDTADWMHTMKCNDCGTNYIYNSTKDILKRSAYNKETK